MGIEKKPHKEVIGKAVVTKEGKRLGIVKDITFETSTNGVPYNYGLRSYP